MTRTAGASEQKAVEVKIGDGAPAWLGDRVAVIEGALVERARRAWMPGNLRGAVEYALLGGGKRLRPVLVCEACFACGGDVEASLDAACALEMIHAFSLVHDDLPALDDDDLRRGRPTVHRQYGEAMAVLVGDALLNLAFQTIALGGGDASGACLGEIARATNAMIGGQVLDTLGGFEAGLDIEARVRQVHENKTGALIRAACRMGALVARGGDESDPDVGALTGYGERIGLMFQVVDDLLDVEQSSEHLGKRAGKDDDAGKLTYPNAIGVEGSRRVIAGLGEAARESIAGLGPEADGLRELVGYLERRTR